MKIDIIFAEFGNKNTVPIENIKKYFPEANIIVYKEKDCPDVFTGKTNFPDKVGWHMNDFWKVSKLLKSNADIAICFDADIKIVSEKVRTIIPLVKKFGLCLPVNPRSLVAVDTEIGSHSDKRLDETLGMAHAVNMTPIAFDTSNSDAYRLIRVYQEEMLHNPARGPLAMWRAIWRTGFMPCLLPKQWCVCQEDIGCGNEIILHVGHEKVKDFYEL